MTEKNEARARARAPMGTHWSKTLLSLLMAVVMVVGLLPVTVLAEETAADTRKVVTRVEGRSYHLGLSGFDAPAYGWPNDYKSRPEIEITKITFEGGEDLENPSRDDIYTLDGSDGKNWERQVDGGDWENYSMTAYPKFIEGTYRYVVKLRVAQDKYRFGESVEITITDEYHGGGVWTKAERSFDNQWYIISPDYTVEDYGYLIDNTKIEGKQLSIGESKVRAPIKEIDLNSSVMGGTKPYKFEKTADSPEWITVSEDGKVSGTPTGTTEKATELKVKVTDGGTPAKTVTLTIPVGRTFPATDERIELAYVQVELKDVLPALGASTDLFPRFKLVKVVAKDGSEVKDIPDNAIVFNHAMGNMGSWQKLNEETGGYEGYYKTTFEDFGTYRFGMLLRIQNTGTIAFGEQYKLADGFNVQMYKDNTLLTGENEWKKKNAWSFDTYSTVELTSPDYKVNNDWRNLEGNVVITCTVRTGEPISTHVSGCNAPAGNLRYQWQKQSAKDGTWSNWGKPTESGSMSGDMVQADNPGAHGTGAVRVIVSAVGYEGKLISAPRPINPAVHTEEPAMPKVRYLKNGENGVLLVTNPIGYKQQQDYLLSKAPLTQEQLDTADKRTTETGDAVLGHWTSSADVCVLGNENVFKASPNTLYYVYTRLAGGRGYLAGKEYRYTTIYTGNSSSLIDLARLMLDGYTNYGVGNTIYIPINGTVTINVKKEPENASTWQIIRLKAYAVNPSETETVPFSIATDDGNKTEIEVEAGTSIPDRITLKAGDTAGTGYLGAFYPSASGNYGSFYGKWNVVVYDPNNITSFDVVNPPVYSDVKLGVGDTYTPANVKPNIATRPEGALDGYELKWYARVGTGTAGNPVFITSDESHKNEFISVDKNTGVVTALKVHGEGDDIYKQVALYAIKGSTQKYLASYSVTVEAAAEKEGALLVNPGSLSIEKGETASLTAQVAGLPEGAGEGTFEWTSGEMKVATISMPVSGGKDAEVTAVGHGDTTIVVTYKYTVNGAEKKLSTAVPVSVHQWGEWQKLDENTHRRECEKCSAVETENHYPTAEGGSSIQPGTGGKTVWKCNACGYTWDNSAYHTVKLDANGGTVTPDYALVSDVGGVGFLPTPERSGYSFSGWYTEKTGGTKVTGDTKLDKSVSTLYARWSTKHHYDGSGGTTTNKPVKSPGTGDAGIVLYAAMGLLSLTGGAWVVGKKRKDK